MMTNNFVFDPDLAAKTIRVAREFNAPIEKVWKAFTDPGLLAKWTAPKPWTAQFKVYDFTVGGISLYAMASPEGHIHWVYDEFTAIENGSVISTMGMHCDGDGNPVLDGPKSYKDTTFSSIDGNRTKVDTVLTFEDEATIKWFVEGGFKEGTTITFDQLDELLAPE
jgi:uncharacterized protein YndB with AHSA1/START domain